MYNFTRIQLFIIDEVSSSTLVEALASHDNNRQEIINWNHWKNKLTIKKRSSRLRHERIRVFALDGASQRRVYKRTRLIYTKQLGFLAYWQVITSAFERNMCVRTQCARSQFLRSNAYEALSSVRRGPLTWDARVSADVDMRSNAPSGLERTCVWTQYVRSNALLGGSSFIMHIFHPFNRILMSVTCNALETPKTNKCIRK